MASYYRDSERIDSSLPAIRNSRCDLAGSGLRGGGGSRIDVIEDDEAQRRVRFASQVHSSSTSSLNRDFARDSREYYPRPPSPTCQSRKQVLELQDQLRLYKDELANKEVLISQLKTVESPRPRHIDVTFSKIDESFSSDRVTALASARSDVAALQVKVDGLTAQLREVKSQLDAREDKIRELKMEVEMARETEAKHVAISHSLQQRLVEFETTAGNLEGAATRSEVVISSLKRDKDDANSKILELESRLRNYVEERSSIEQKLIGCENKYQDIMKQVTSALSVEDITMSSSVGDLVFKLREMVQDNATMRGKLATMSEYLRSAEVENKASRETILRLVSESEKEHSAASRYSLDIDALRQERDQAMSRKSEYEQELRLLKERLDASQNAWAATRKELEEKEQKYNHYNREVRETEMLVRGHEVALRSFKEELAGMLSDGCCVIEPNQEQIRDRVAALIRSIHDKSSHITLLESKVSTLAEQLEKQYEMQKSADRRAQRVEGDYLELESKVRKLDSELSSENAMREGMRSDKEKYLRFLEMCCRALKLDVMASDVGFDLSMEAIVGRCEQLVKQEGDAVAERQTHIYNLQRKVKAVKEQLESRDLHIDLLRKKVAALEERLVGKTEVEREKDTEAVKNKKLMKLVEKYKREVQEAHFELRELKAKLLETSEYRNRTLEAENHIGSLTSKVDQLEKVRQKQAHKIASLKDNIETTTTDIHSKSENANQTIQALTRELRTTKVGLDECTKREKQLLDLRQVVARMLGLDMNVLAVPDYEIISRLEKLILANQSSVVTAAAIDGALVDMEDGFREGYQDPGRVFVRARSPVKKVTTLRTRTRSLSPSRRKDNRVY